MNQVTGLLGGLVLMTLAGGVALGAIPAQEKESRSAGGRRVITVASQGQADYHRIQAAIDAAPANAVIQITSGTYEEQLTISKPLTLQGAGPEQTVIFTKNFLGELRSPDNPIILEMKQKIEAAKSAAERRAVETEYEQKYMERIKNSSTLLVRDAQGVEIHDLKLSSPGQPRPGVFAEQAILVCRRAGVLIDHCAVTDSPNEGIHILDGAVVEMRNSLVAAVWGTGIRIGLRREPPAKSVNIHESDIRNCHYAGIQIGQGGDATVIERCRISGAAWHGIRYDDVSPRITGCVVFGNARSGIYASGKTAATVRDNLFFRNEMDGISCWFANRDMIEGNTFAANLREGIAVLGDSAPLLRGNIFYSQPEAVSCSPITGNNSRAAGTPRLENNFFWKNEKNTVRNLPGKDDKTWTKEETALDAKAGNKIADPLFVNGAQFDFVLAADSTARAAGIGVAQPLALASPWTLQPEEKTIIPDGETRDFNAWKRPAEQPPLASGKALKPARPN